MYFPSIKSIVSNNKNERYFKKPTISIVLNFLQVCPSVPSFAFLVLIIIIPFNVLSDYFYVLLSVEEVPTFKILIKFLSLLF